MALFFVYCTNPALLRLPFEVPTAPNDQQANILSLNDSQCTALFPDAFEEIEFALTRGPIDRSLEDVDVRNGHVRARIYNGALYVIDRGHDVRHRQSAILHQIHRAIITAPSPSEIPNIDFEFSVNDHPSADVWSLARSDAIEEFQNMWLMPDSGFWSGPEPHIGSLHEIHERIIQTEGSMTWAEKHSKALWRDSVEGPKGLGAKLLETAQDQDWSDVEQLKYSSGALNMEEICRYKYLIYTEDVAYPSRLRNYQMCRSVIISPELKWQQTTSSLISSSGPDQNMVIVKEDWSDLARTIERLEANPDHAERIANNTARTFRDWYLRPGVETCYWRKLFRAWAEVTDSVKELALDERGTRFESFVLNHKKSS
ncbi:hypothetical protein LTR10_023985 [Elasticomyces elasticus]|uniref:Glycosyl transferase CAP10 domain-containing protein n=1 Tax=Exophiala sideris TaxID=1016849 RepID=A0ABR0JII5_9EURO|nr:hypothetical protein LTR10_023985 [Elasticomyces elasticus]KAK5034221.1 hypothetical protein LTS07_003141 [Exophiala sideris]KAK5042517.1 hypothetical protein LTR13_001364 [Exophiala sideris]KAK5065599.1 hypothetical protein LTR69_003148 [Exophiala sideris]KAK5185943.1 hypothetical protein LTR44_001992 [Eurotiomycetes sp. CCFEE 6388]